MMAQATQAPSEAAFGIFEWQRDYALKTLEAYKTEVEGRVFPAFGQESRTDAPLPEEASDGNSIPKRYGKPSRNRTRKTSTGRTWSSRKAASWRWRSQDFIISGRGA